MKHIKTGILSAASLAILFCSCAKKDTPPSNQANINYMNACLNTNTTPLDATVGGANVTGGTSLTFLKSSGYLGVTAGTSLIGFYFDNPHSRVADTSVALQASSNYSVYVAGEITSPTTLLMSDDLLTPASGMTKIRFVNLSVDTNAMNVIIGNPAGSANLVTGSTFKTFTPFMQLAGGAMTVLAQNPNSPLDQVEISQSFTNGNIYTIVLTGTRTGTGTAGLTLTVQNNN